MSDVVQRLREELRSIAEDFAPTDDDGVCDTCDGKRDTEKRGACHECLLRERVTQALAETSDPDSDELHPPSRLMEVNDALLSASNASHMMTEPSGKQYFATETRKVDEARDLLVRYMRSTYSRERS
jgi:hypothetical protein